MYQIYQFQEGDTLGSILMNYDTTEEELKKINGIYAEINVIPGNYIIVPSRRKRPFLTYTVQKGDTFFMGNNE